MQNLKSFVSYPIVVLLFLLGMTAKAETFTASNPNDHSSGLLHQADTELTPVAQAAPRFPFSLKGLEPSARRPASAADGMTVDPTLRDNVQRFYNTVYLASNNIAAGWNGDVATCQAGTTSSDYQSAILNRINWFRAMAGVPANIVFDSGFNAKAQQAALMMSANDSLSHQPPMSWNCYTSAGAEAAGNSNLYLGRVGPEAIDGYIKDPGTNNYAAGHRRWILYPQTQAMGTGDIVPTTGGTRSSNALWVFDDHIWGSRPVVRDDFIAWPPKGYTPYQTVYPRWSLSYPNADFSAASITMTRNGSPISVQQEPYVGRYGENTLVWIPAPYTHSAIWVKPDADETYQVTVSNATVDGQPRTFAYTVIVFDPTAASYTLSAHKTGGHGAVTSIPTGIHCGATCSASFGGETVVTLSATPEAGYDFSGWSGTCTNPTGTCTITMDADQSVTAIFAATSTATHVLTITKAGTGSGTVTSTPAGIDCGTDCAASYSAGTTVTLTATPDLLVSPAPPNAFAGWSGGCTGTAPTCLIAMNAVQNVTATFSGGPVTGGLIREYLSRASENVVIAGIAGTTVEYLDFGGNDTYTLTSTLAGAVRITDRQASRIVLPAGLSVGGSRFVASGVELTLNGHPVTLLGNPALFTFVFAGSPDDPGAGVHRTLAETAAVLGASVPAVGQPPVVGTITGTVQADGALLNQPRLTVTKTGTGSGTVTSSPAGINCGGACAANFAAGTPVSLTATPTWGSTFAGWSGACSGTGTCPVTMDQARSVTARFDSGGGGDGDLIPISGRYQPIGAQGGIIRDVETGLQWMRCSLGQTWNGSTCTGGRGSRHDFYGAQTAAQSLNDGGGYGGYTDWRVPSIEELRTLVYCSSGQPAYFINENNVWCQGSYVRPTIVSEAFPNTTTDDGFHSASPSAFHSDSVWFVNFGTGTVGDYSHRIYHSFVRLVR